MKLLISQLGSIYEKAVGVGTYEKITNYSMWKCAKRVKKIN